MTFIGKSVKVVGNTMLESDPTKEPYGEFTMVGPGKVFPPVDELMIADGLTYVVWKDLFNSGTYAMILDNNIEPVPPIPGNVTYASFPWILKMEAVATPKEKSRFNWIWPLLAGLFLFSRK
tara:strand:+ start:307 stop:669 length:363 start_codon:yes stop_codon:yes gene_type:complete